MGRHRCGGRRRHRGGTDGIAWSRESVAELAEVAESEIGAVSRVQTAGGTVVVAVKLRAPEGEIGRQIVLVGTPTG